MDHTKTSTKTLAEIGNKVKDSTTAKAKPKAKKSAGKAPKWFTKSTTGGADSRYVKVKLSGNLVDRFMAACETANGLGYDLNIHDVTARALNDAMAELENVPEAQPSLKL